MTTLGDLVEAAYLAVDGEGREREERAARLLAAFAVSRALSRRLVFT